MQWEWLQVLEKKELDCQSDHTAKKSDLEAKIIHLEEKISNNCDSKSLHDDLDHCISKSLEKLHLAKKVLGLITTLEDLCHLIVYFGPLPECHQSIISA